MSDKLDEIAGDALDSAETFTVMRRHIQSAYDLGRRGDKAEQRAKTAKLVEALEELLPPDADFLRNLPGDQVTHDRYWVGWVSWVSAIDAALAAAKASEEKS